MAARLISQCNQSSPTSVITRNIGYSQTIIKPKILSFWLLLAIAPNNRIKKQVKCRRCRYGQLKPSQLRKLLDHRKSISCFTAPLRTSIRKMILLVKQPIHHEYAHLYFAIDQKTTAKTKDTCEIQYKQCHHQYHTSSDDTSQGATTYPFIQIVIVCISAPPVSFWSCLHQKNTTSFLDLQRLFDLNMKYTLSNLPGVVVCIPAPPVPFWSCLHQKNTASFSDLQRLFDVNMKNTLSFTRRYCTYISSTSFLLVLSTPEKHYKFFGFTKTV